MSNLSLQLLFEKEKYSHNPFNTVTMQLGATLLSKNTDLLWRNKSYVITICKQANRTNLNPHHQTKLNQVVNHEMSLKL